MDLSLVYSLINYCVIVIACVILFIMTSKILERPGYYDKDLDRYYEDTGCGASPKCQDCPYKQCIIELPYTLRLMILKAPLILKVFESYDNGMRIVDLTVHFEVPISTIKNWIAKRLEITSKIKSYAG